MEIYEIDSGDIYGFIKRWVFEIEIQCVERRLSLAQVVIYVRSLQIYNVGMYAGNVIIFLYDRSYWHRIIETLSIYFHTRLLKIDNTIENIGLQENFSKF